ncbi:CBS domain-containing protein [Clostridium facile]|uniref:CBS domain-containing protein n=1 Tax=Clostridium facile TaxID=2763035 RepID=A0ABR7IT96_9CLOT|nr:CBS domain-containing protein [Clostridium facile]MBC5788350.1 CBS domain-containing protein [Clostridium facile]
MLIKDVMSRHIAIVGEETTIADTAVLMEEYDIGVVPVVEQKQLLGVVTDRDIVLRCVAKGKDITQTKVKEVMSKNMVSVSPDQPLDMALQAMAGRQVKRLAVTDQGKLAGVISLSDIARIRSSAETSWALTEISMP